MATSRQVEMLTENSREARLYILRKLHQEACDRYAEAREGLANHPDSYSAKSREARTKRTLRILFDKLTNESRSTQ